MPRTREITNYRYVLTNKTHDVNNTGRAHIYEYCTRYREELFSRHPRFAIACNRYMPMVNSSRGCSAVIYIPHYLLRFQFCCVNIALQKSDLRSTRPTNENNNQQCTFFFRSLVARSQYYDELSSFPHIDMIQFTRVHTSLHQRASVVVFSRALFSRSDITLEAHNNYTPRAEPRTI